MVYGHAINLCVPIVTSTKDVDGKQFLIRRPFIWSVLGLCVLCLRFSLLARVSSPALPLVLCRKLNARAL